MRRQFTAGVPLWTAVGIVAASAAATDWTIPDDPAYRRYPADPHQEALFLLEMEKAWALEKGSPAVVVAVIDLAFDPSHPDLKGKLWTNPREVPGNGLDDDGNGFADDLHGWDFLDNDATLEGPQAEHGNHVAGIIGAETNNGLGIAGMAPGCPLMLLKVGLPGCLRDGGIMARAIRYAVANGARLICMNHGLSEHYPGWHVPVGGELKQACDEAYRQGVLIVSCTTSNDGAFYPATFPPAYDSVMGTGASDIEGKPSGMYGGSLFCEAIAPGGERTGGDDHNRRSIYSCYAGSQLYHYYAGGCMATPHVVGLLALVLSHYPGLDVEQARQIVRNTARGEAPGFQPRWGHGLIQPLAALSLGAGELVALPALASAQVEVGRDALGDLACGVSVSNRGVFDAAVRVSLLAGWQVVAARSAIAVGLESTVVWFPAAGLPPAGDMTARIEDLGRARPRMYSLDTDIRLRLREEDIGLQRRTDGRLFLRAAVRNAGTAGAERVAVIVHEHEPGVPSRQGPPSRMVAATVIAVPAGGVSAAEFAPEALSGAADLWVEIENLGVGAPHIERQAGKARYRGGALPAAPRAAREIADFAFAAGTGQTVAATGPAALVGRLSGAAWATDGDVPCVRFPGPGAAIEVPDHPALAGMPALRIDARAKWDRLPSDLEPLVYKWRSGDASASFGLALLRGSPYCLIRTGGPGFVEVVCEDLKATPGEWHVVSLVYSGGTLSAELDGRPSAIRESVSGAVAPCREPLRLGAATDKAGRLVASLGGKLAGVRLSSPGSGSAQTRIPGTPEVDRVVRVLPPGEPEVLYASLPAGGHCRVALAFVEDEGARRVALRLAPEHGTGPVHVAELTRSRPSWEGELAAGVYALELTADERLVYGLSIQGAEDVWQAQFRATDRGAGAAADYTAWLSVPDPAQAGFELFDCAEGARWLILPEDGTVQVLTQTGGVMGDSSQRSGGAGVWRRHRLVAGGPSGGAWLYCPSRVNAAGDYAIRGDFTVHWRRPPAAVLAAFAESPSLRPYRLTTRGGETTAGNRTRRYAETADAGLGFMRSLTEPCAEFWRIHERWYLDEGAPRQYWGCDGQMLCAMAYLHASASTRNTGLLSLALAIARNVIRHQDLDPKSFRFGALPYGMVGQDAALTWATSSNIQGKILYGLAQVATASGETDLVDALKRNADYAVRMQYPDGRWPHFVDRTPQSVCGYDSAWGAAGLLVAYRKLGNEAWLRSAEQALEAYRRGREPGEGLQPDGSLVCYCNHATSAEDGHAIRSTITMLTPFALAYGITRKVEYRQVLDGLCRYLVAHQDASGAIRQAGDDCVNLVYAQNWGPIGFCEAYEATGERRFLEAGLRLADFLVRVQVLDQDPHLHGAWVGSYNLAKDFPGGNIDDEGNLYDLYTSWTAGPIVYGLQRLLSQIEAR
jgi:hypothetical protein